jgi:hypothetical protein
MIAVIFEFTPAEGRFPQYMDLVGELSADLAHADGFIYRLRIAEVSRDYTMDERTQAPEDSRGVHG